MPITANCPRYDHTITAQTEDDLIRQVQAHARDDHGLTHPLPEKHVRAMIQRQAENDER